MGEIDIALGIAIDLPSRISQLTLFTEPYVCVMRPGHPLARQRLSYEDYLGAQHLAVTHLGEPIQALDVQLRTKGTKRWVAMTINQALLAPEILREFATYPDHASPHGAQAARIRRSASGSPAHGDRAAAGSDLVASRSDEASGACVAAPDDQ